MIELLIAAALTPEQIQSQCVYQSGLASRVQDIRRSGETWQQFQNTTSKIYKDDEGYETLLDIAYMVYNQLPADMPSDEVAQSMFDACVGSHYRRQNKGYEFSL